MKIGDNIIVKKHINSLFKKGTKAKIFSINENAVYKYNIINDKNVTAICKQSEIHQIKQQKIMKTFKVKTPEFTHYLNSQGKITKTMFKYFDFTQIIEIPSDKKGFGLSYGNKTHVYLGELTTGSYVVLFKLSNETINNARY